MPLKTKKANWNQRIERADDLARSNPGAAEVLHFYRRILEFQKTIYDRMSIGSASNPDVPLREALNIDVAVKELPGLLSLVQSSGPSKLAAEAAELTKASSEQHRSGFDRFLEDREADEVGHYTFFGRVLFQPMAEFAALTREFDATAPSPPVCPLCGAKPQLAVLRPEGDGGKRFLACSFCLTEWEFRRILCPICEETDHSRLPRYEAEDITSARVEACETCNYYLKSIDMTVDGLAVPVVDEIATASLDVWAIERGFHKIKLNLMGF